VVRHGDDAHPAARAARRPLVESSTAAHPVGAVPRRRATARYTSGAGLPRPTVSVDITTWNRSHKSIASRITLMSPGGEDVATASRQQAARDEPLRQRRVGAARCVRGAARSRVRRPVHQPADIVGSGLLVNRAGETVVVLGSVLVSATVVLIPGQSRGALSAELLAVAITTFAVVWRLQPGARTARTGDDEQGVQPRASLIFRRALGLGAQALLAAGRSPWRSRLAAGSTGGPLP
jgi:hypothetical protein